MKNLKISKKILFGFGLALLLTAIVGLSGISGFYLMGESSHDMYEAAHTQYDLARAVESFENMRMRSMELVAHNGNSAALPAVEASILASMTDFEERMQSYQASIATPEAQRVWENTMSRYSTSVRPDILSLLESAKRGTGTYALLDQKSAIDNAAEAVSDNLFQLFKMRNEYIGTLNAQSISLGQMLMFIVVAIFALSLIGSLLFVFYMNTLISKPLALLDEWLQMTAKNGDIVFKPEELAVAKPYESRLDEIGRLFRSYADLIQYMNETCDELKIIADGNLALDIDVVSDYDLLSLTLQKMVDDLRKMISEINAVSRITASGALHVANGASSLGEGVAQQTTLLQQLSESVSELMRRIREDEVSTQRAAGLADAIAQSADDSSQQMDEMIGAVTEIQQAGQSIGKVIKVIEDIAFQTNILALNAAVEAARAGQHGKGFAVVADEVRTLAAKSAEAAKETGELITNSMEKSELGASIANRTAQSLERIVSSIAQNHQIVNEISDSVQEQIGIFEDINNDIEKVAAVMEQLEGVASENAASAEEISGQSDILKGLVKGFKLKQSASSGAPGMGAGQTGMTLGA